MRTICLYYDLLFRVPHRPGRVVGRLGAVRALAEREAREVLVLDSFSNQFPRRGIGWGDAASRGT